MSESAELELSTTAEDAVDAALQPAELSALAEELVEQARADGVELTGPQGLLTALIKKVLGAALEVEMADHLGYARDDRVGHGSGNSRNGTTSKTVRTDVGEVRMEVPRDRNGSFDPVVVPKRSRRLAGFDDAVLSLYAKGMTTGDITAHLADICGTQVSRNLVSRVTDAVLDDMQDWATRPLNWVYRITNRELLHDNRRGGHYRPLPRRFAAELGVALRQGYARLLTPLFAVLGARWERRNWVRLRDLFEQDPPSP